MEPSVVLDGLLRTNGIIFGMEPERAAEPEETLMAKGSEELQKPPESEQTMQAAGLEDVLNLESMDLFREVTGETTGQEAASEPQLGKVLPPSFLLLVGKLHHKWEGL